MKYWAMIAALLPLAAQAGERAVILAPVSVPAHDEGAPDAGALGGILLGCISQSPSVAVLERADLGLAASQQALARGGYAAGTGGVTYRGAGYVVTASAASLHKRWLVSLQASEAASTRMVAAYSAELAPHYEEAAICEELVNPFLRDFANAAEKETPDEGQGAKQTEADALLMRGAGYARSGNYAKAFPPLLKLLDREPDHADARYWLALSYAKAGMADLARQEAEGCIRMFPAHPMRAELEAALANIAEGEAR